MADFGNGPYAWLRGADRSPPYVGSNVADATGWVSDTIQITDDLKEQFSDWVTEFEKKYKSEEFDWDRWNKEGIELARLLKKDIGDTFMVEYHFPCEDPIACGEGDSPPILKID